MEMAVPSVVKQQVSTYHNKPENIGNFTMEHVKLLLENKNMTCNRH